MLKKICGDGNMTPLKLCTWCYINLDYYVFVLGSIDPDIIIIIIIIIIICFCSSAPMFEQMYNVQLIISPL